MERIAQIVFVAVGLSLFYYVFGFSVVLLAGNGGEYWGFNGTREPWREARSSFESGEYRFLAYRLNGDFGPIVSGYPNVYRCDIHATSEHGHIRFNQIDAKHGADSVRKANGFARDYNDMLAMLLAKEGVASCEKVEAE